MFINYKHINFINIYFNLMYSDYIDKLYDENSPLYDYYLGCWLTSCDYLTPFYVYDDNKKLKYCRYNFNIKLYMETFPNTKFDEPLEEQHHNYFMDFMTKNGNDDFNIINNPNTNPLIVFDNPLIYEPLMKPYVVLPEFEYFFSPITDDIIYFVNTYGDGLYRQYNPFSGSVLNQNDFVDTSNNTYRIIDFMSTDHKDFLRYNKYNFDFNKFQADFKVYGSKLLTYIIFIAKSSLYFAEWTGYHNYYAIYEPFKKYFKPMTDEIFEYMTSNGLFSNLPYVGHTLKKLNYTSFIEDNPSIIAKLQLLYDDFDNNKNKYIDDYICMEGQFEMIPLKFIEDPLMPIEICKNTVCTVFLNTPNKTPSYCGFTFWKYHDIITSYDLIKDYPYIKTIYALFENRYTTQIIEYNILGFDKVSNLLVGRINENPDNMAKYDYLSQFMNYDANNFIDGIDTTKVFGNVVGSNVYVIENMNDNDCLTVATATIMKQDYGGGFSINGANEIMPESLVISSHFHKMAIGSPIFYSKNINDPEEEIYIIGIVTADFNATNKNSNTNLFLGLNYILANTVIKAIANNPNVGWYLPVLENSGFNLSTDFIETINDSYLREGYIKSWLGIDAIYYSYKSKYIWPELANFPYVGGLIVENIINGYDTISNQFVFNGAKNMDKATIRLFSPLENTPLHMHIVQTCLPVIIEYIGFLDVIYGNVTKLYVGKYANQKSYSNYIYGHQPIITDAKVENLLYGYVNVQKRYYNPIKIKYWYFDGIKWQNNIIDVGSLDDDFFVDYQNEVYKYRQNKFEWPAILYNYIKTFTINN